MLQNSNADECADDTYFEVIASSEEIFCMVLTVILELLVTVENRSFQVFWDLRHTVEGGKKRL